MRTLAGLAVCVLLSVLPVYALQGGGDGAPDLSAWLLLQRSVYPAAAVSGSFYDWRTVSRYRAHAGLHLGYDIALPAGTPVLTGWPGQVTAVTLWSGVEYGITLVSPSGYAITFGHLHPRVHVGDVLNPGDAVGTVAVDHVDIKMRGPDGNFFDFGHSQPGPAVVAPFTDAQRLVAQHGNAWVRGRLAMAEREVERRQMDTREAWRQHTDGILSRQEAGEVEDTLAEARARLSWLQDVQRYLRTDATLRRARAAAGPTAAQREERQLQHAIEALVPPPAMKRKSPVAQDVDALYRAGAISQVERQQSSGLLAPVRSKGYTH